MIYSLLGFFFKLVRVQCFYRRAPAKVGSNLNMNKQRIKNILDPVNEQDSVNKRYLESQLEDYLKRNGQNLMTFNLNMNNYKMLNLKNFDSGNTTDTDVSNNIYI